MPEPLDLRNQPAGPRGRQPARVRRAGGRTAGGLCARELPLPEVAEVDLMRHYIHLSQMNYGVDSGFYPLGSCTMKYNPKVNEVACRLPGFACIASACSPKAAPRAPWS